MGQHMDRLQRMLGAMGEGVGKVDDFVQGGIRDHILRLPKDKSELPAGAPLGGLRHGLGGMIHQDRRPNNGYYSRGDTAGDMRQLLAARAAQAGGLAGVTAAGAALMDQLGGFQEAAKAQVDTSKPQYEPLPITERDQMVMEDVVRGLEDGSLSDIQLNEAAKNGAFTKPQLALISDVYDFSRLGEKHYPFGDKTIIEAIHS